MKKRFFAFGCSYTRYCYPSWADFIGVNFDEYYNYGRAGASNTYIMNKLVEADDKFNFNSDNDTVIVMLTGIGRFSYMIETQWITNGELLSNFAYTKDPKVGKIIDSIWNENWLVYQTWIATKTIKNLLSSKKIPHKILMSIDNSEYFKGSDNFYYGNKIYNLLDIKKSMDQWRKESTENNDSPIYRDTNKADGHPSMKAHYKFLKEHIPEFITNRSKELLDESELAFDYSSFANQLENDKQFSKKYDKAYTTLLFGQDPLL